MSKNETESKPPSVEEPREKGLDETDCSRSFDDLMESLDAWIEDALKGSKPIGLTLSRARVAITDGRDRIAEIFDALEYQNKEVEKLRAAIRNLRDVSGRHHSQIACERLFALLPERKAHTPAPPRHPMKPNDTPLPSDDPEANNASGAGCMTRLVVGSSDTPETDAAFPLSDNWHYPDSDEYLMQRKVAAKLERERERDGRQRAYDAALRQMNEAIAKAEWYRTDAIRDLERQVDEARAAAYLWQDRWMNDTPLEECGGTLMPWMAGWKDSSDNAPAVAPATLDVASSDDVMAG